MLPLIEVDLRGLDPHQPQGLSAYSIPLVEALLKSDTGHRYRVLEPGRGPGADGDRVHTLLSFDGSCRVSRQVRSVVLVPDLGYLSARRTYSFPQWIGCSWRVGWAARKADRVIAPSLAVATGLSHYLRVSSQRISLVAPAVRFGRSPRPRVEELKRDLRLPARYFLYLGSLRPRKNLELLLRAWRVAAPTIPPDIELVVAGPSSQGSVKLEHAVAVTPSCRRLGYVGERDIPALLSGAIAWLNPSLYEGTGQGALEAMSCGTPPVVAAAGAQPEVVGTAGLVLEPDDHLAWSAAIALLAREEEVRSRFSRHARAAARRFSQEESVRSLQAALHPAPGEDRGAAAGWADQEAPGPGSQDGAAELEG